MVLSAVRNRNLSVARSGAALVGAATALAGAPAAWAATAGGVLVGLAVAYQVVLLIWEWRHQTWRTHFVRISEAAALTVAVAGWIWSRSHLDQPLAVALDRVTLILSVIALLVAIWLTRMVLADSRLTIRARHLPGGPAEAPKQARLAAGWLVVGLAAAWLLGYVAGLLALPGFVFAVLALLVAGLMFVVRSGYRGYRGYHRQLMSALNALKPVYAMPYNGVAGFHVGMWAPYLVRTGRPVFVVTTEAVAYRKVSRTNELPILYAPDASRTSLRQLFPSSVRAACYVYNGLNRNFVAQRGITHVFLQHGDSDKATSVNPVTRRYDVIVVAGQAAIDRFATTELEIPREKFKILGRPQTSGIHTVTRPIAGAGQPLVLYAPTWKGKSDEANYSSLLLGERIVEALLARGAAVVFRPHPAGRHYPPHTAAIAAIRARLEADAEATGRPHLWGKAAESLSVAEVSNLVDAMVSDVSGIVTDFMQSLKPFAMVATRGTVADFRRDFPTSQSAYVISADLGTLDQALAEMLGEDPLAGVRAERRTYYLGGFDEEGSERAFAAFLDELAGPKSRATRVPERTPLSTS